MKNFQRISKVDDKDIPLGLAKSTLYKWAKSKKYPEAFKEFEGLRLVDITKLEELILGKQNAE